MNKIPLHWQILIGLTLGVVYAMVATWLGWGGFTEDWVAPWGRIFINLLKLIAVPLVLFSIVGGIASLGSPAQLGRMGAKTLLLYLATSLLAIGLGLTIAVLAKPGHAVGPQMRLKNRLAYEIWANENQIPLPDGTRALSHNSNARPIGKTASPPVAVNGIDNSGDATAAVMARGPLAFVEDWVPGNIFLVLGDNREMLKVIFFALLMGIAVLFVPRNKTQSLLKVIDGLNEVFIKMVEMVMRAAPFFVFALMASVISQQAGSDAGRAVDLFKGLGLYSLCVLTGLGFIAFVVYPLFVKYFISGITYRDFLKGIGAAQLLAFSTSSSAATLPVTMECAEENLKVDKRVVSFVLPIGSTVNMDGTSLYQAVAVVFLAQMHGIDLGLEAYFTILFTTMMASVGSAAIPGAGVVMLMVVLTSVGLNPAWIAIILPVDRILDMFRTVINVTGDVVVALIVDRTTPQLPVSPNETGNDS